MSLSEPPQNRKASLDRAVDRLSRWLEFWTFIVAAGLIVEYAPDIIDAFRKRHAPSLPVVGGIVITIGVVGELWIGLRSATRAIRLREVNDALIAEANERAATAEQRAAEANRAAEQERLERVKLEAKIAPRFLSREEREVLSSRIRSAQVKLVDLFLYGSTPEIVRLSRQLAEALTSANWNVQVWNVYGNAAVAGIAISVVDTADPNTSASAELLLTALDEAGLDVITRTWLDREGSKPQGIIGPVWDPTKAAPIRIHLGVKP